MTQTTPASNEETSSIEINIRSTDGRQSSLRINPTVTVLEFQRRVADLMDVPVEAQLLIYRGQSINQHPTRTIGSFIQSSGHVIHLARRSPSNSNAQRPTSTPSPPQRGPNSSFTFPGTMMWGFMDGDSQNLFGQLAGAMGGMGAMGGAPEGFPPANASMTVPGMPNIRGLPVGMPGANTNFGGTSFPDFINQSINRLATSVPQQPTSNTTMPPPFTPNSPQRPPVPGNVSGNFNQTESSFTSGPTTTTTYSSYTFPPQTTAAAPNPTQQTTTTQTQPSRTFVIRSTQPTANASSSPTPATSEIRTGNVTDVSASPQPPTANAPSGQQGQGRPVQTRIIFHNNPPTFTQSPGGTVSWRGGTGSPSHPVPTTNQLTHTAAGPATSVWDDGVRRAEVDAYQQFHDALGRFASAVEGGTGWRLSHLPTPSRESLPTDEAISSLMSLYKELTQVLNDLVFQTPLMLRPPERSLSHLPVMLLANSEVQMKLGRLVSVQQANGGGGGVTGGMVGAAGGPVVVIGRPTAEQGISTTASKGEVRDGGTPSEAKQRLEAAEKDSKRPKLGNASEVNKPETSYSPQPSTSSFVLPVTASSTALSTGSPIVETAPAASPSAQTSSAASSSSSSALLSASSGPSPVSPDPFNSLLNSLAQGVGGDAPEPVVPASSGVETMNDEVRERWNKWTGNKEAFSLEIQKCARRAPPSHSYSSGNPVVARSTLNRNDGPSPPRIFDFNWHRSLNYVGAAEAPRPPSDLGEAYQGAVATAIAEQARSNPDFNFDRSRFPNIERVLEIIRKKAQENVGGGNE
eukprot:GHVN01024760.1.p1 GENE.GHVN01024760.1~~GHVN01024760.1.p1  ORF type:complete len:802 (-),score=180.61 GHVN01024760.1:1250-3655(-)